MNKIRKISEITVDDLVYFLRIPEIEVDEDIRNLLESCLGFAKAHAASYTNRTIEELDEYPELAYAILVGAADFYTQRDSSNETKGTGNDVFKKILGPYRVGRIG